MRPQLNRLPADTGKGLAGTHIDRNKPLSFTLNDRQVVGFAGDTVLSALLASGIDTLGTHSGYPIGLRSGATPAIAYRTAEKTDYPGLPMDRTPASNGADYVIVAEHAPSGFLSRLFQPGRTLGLKLDEHGKSLVRPWRSLAGETQSQTDLVVIGGGVAGMAAALAGAEAGLAVTLVEATPRLGGNSGLFGTQDGEVTPQENVEALSVKITVTESITVLTSCQVFAITEGLVRAHQVHEVDGKSKGRVIDLPTRFVLLANGALERLPVLSGNRLPGVTGALEAFELAYRYGVWPGRSWLLATSSNPAYRLGTVLADTGISLDRILDSRDRASSRYIEFCKAYGIRQFPGTTPLSVAGQKAGGRLFVSLPQGDAVAVERLVLCGGWQPDLSLWHMAGGRSRWNSKLARLEPVGTVPGLFLAGSAAGHFTRIGCLTSGVDAIDRLLGRKGRGIDDPVLDVLYETPDGMMSAPPPDPDKPVAPAYLDADEALLMRPAAPRKHWVRLLRRGKPAPVRVLAEAPQPLSIGAISAGVSLGLIPPESAGVVAQERVALVPLSIAKTHDAPATDLPDVPTYLEGRFGSAARIVVLEHDPSRQVGSGALIYSDEDVIDPRLAIGVVLRQVEGQTRALIAGEVADIGRAVVIRDLGQTFRAEINA